MDALIPVRNVATLDDLGRQFSIRDINGVALIFWQPQWLAPSGESTSQA